MGIIIGLLVYPVAFILTAWFIATIAATWILMIPSCVMLLAYLLLREVHELLERIIDWLVGYCVGLLDDIKKATKRQAD